MVADNRTGAIKRRSSTKPRLDKTKLVTHLYSTASGWTVCVVTFRVQLLDRRYIFSYVGIKSAEDPDSRSFSRTFTGGCYIALTHRHSLSHTRRVSIMGNQCDYLYYLYYWRRLTSLNEFLTIGATKNARVL